MLMFIGSVLGVCCIVISGVLFTIGYLLNLGTESKDKGLVIINTRRKLLFFWSGMLLLLGILYIYLTYHGWNELYGKLIQ